MKEKITEKYYPINLERDVYYIAKGIYKFRKKMDYDDYEDYKPYWNGDIVIAKQWIREKAEWFFFGKLQRKKAIYDGIIPEKYERYLN